MLPLYATLLIKIIDPFGLLGTTFTAGYRAFLARRCRREGKGKFNGSAILRFTVSALPSSFCHRHSTRIAL